MDHIPGHKERRGERSGVTGVFCYEHFVKENPSAWLFDFGNQISANMAYPAGRNLPRFAKRYDQVLPSFAYFGQFLRKDIPVIMGFSAICMEK